MNVLPRRILYLFIIRLVYSHILNNVGINLNINVSVLQFQFGHLIMCLNEGCNPTMTKFVTYITHLEVTHMVDLFTKKR